MASSLLPSDVRLALDNPAFKGVLKAVHDALGSRIHGAPLSTLVVEVIAACESETTLQNAQSALAVCEFLEKALRHLPPTSLTQLAARIFGIYGTAIERHSQDSGVLKRVLGTLSNLLPFLPSADPPVVKALAKTLFPVLAHPESGSAARIAAQVLLGILQSESIPSVHSEICADLTGFAKSVIEAPFVQAAAAAEITASKKRSKMQDALDASVMAVVNLLSALTMLVPYLTKSALHDMLSHLWIVFDMQQPQIMAKACSVFTTLFVSTGALELDAATVASILQELCKREEAVHGTSPEFSLSAVEAVIAGLRMALRHGCQHLILNLAQFLPFLIRKMLSEFEELRGRAREQVTGLLTDAIEEKATMNRHQEGDMETASACDAISEQLTIALGLEELETLTTLLPMIRMLYRLMGSEGVKSELLEKLGEIYVSLDQGIDMDLERQERPAELSHLEACVGEAIRQSGTPAILQTLPLTILQDRTGTDREPCLWILPLIEKYAHSEHLQFWVEALYPIAERVRRERETTSVQDERYFKLRLLEDQIWSTLPSFGRWPRDLPSHFPQLSEFLEQICAARPELTKTVSAALYQICHSALSGMQTHVDQSAKMETGDEEVVSKSIPHHFTAEVAEGSIEVLRSHSERWIRLLTSFNAPDPESVELRAFAQMASIASPEVSKAFYQETKNRLYQAFQSADKNPRKECSYFDILYSMLPCLDIDDIQEIVKVAELLIQSNVAYHVQKKAYKMLAYVIQYRPNAWITKSAEMATLLESSCQCCQNPSIQFRLRCIKEFLSHQTTTAVSGLNYDELVATFLSEVLLALEDPCVKARKKAQETLLQISDHYITSGRLQSLMLWLRTALGSDDVSMVAAVLRAYQSLTETHGSQHCVEITEVVHSVVQLVGVRGAEMSKTPMVKCVLDFLMTVVEQFPPSALAPLVEELMRVLMEWEPPMIKARVKTQALMQEMCEKVGFPVVQPLVPECYSRMMRNFRKQHRRGTSLMEASEQNTQTGTAQTYLTKQTSRRSETKTLRSARTTVTGALSAVDSGDAKVEVDLLDPSETRRLAKAAAGQVTESLQLDRMQDDGFELPVSSEGKLIINERSLKKTERLWRKRHANSTQSVSDGRSLTMKSGAPSKSSHITKSKISKSKTSAIKSHHSGQRFKARKGAGGDAQGASRLEPFAYWKLDRNLLNKRRGKRKMAMKDLRKISRSGRGR